MAKINHRVYHHNQTLLSSYNHQKKYNIKYVLTILSFSNHKLKDILIGQQPYDNLEDFVKGKQQKKELVLLFSKAMNKNFQNYNSNN